MLDDEQVGQLLASQARCETEQKAMREELTSANSKLEELASRFDELIAREAQARGGMMVARWILGVVLGVVLSGGGWLVSHHLEHGNSLTTHEVRIERLQADVAQHEAYGRELRHDVSALSGDLREVTGALEQLREQQAETLEALRERRR